jgi:multiple sugar transport system ATP-binding protein
MLAGFDTATYGSIYIDDRRVNTVKPQERGLSMVFQSYALFPHMNVYKNLAFGLSARRTPRARIRARVEEVSALLDIAPLLERRPAQLSGGQRQRVALGRAMISEPKVFLMDEPLSNLDAALRVQMRFELTRLHQRLNSTTIYVTHDQVEAMTMGDQIAVMRDGRIQQLGEPAEIYGHPANRFVAEFIGSPKINIVPAKLRSRDGVIVCSCLGLDIPVPSALGKALDSLSTDAVLVGVRPEDLRWTQETDSSGDVEFSAEIKNIEPLGSETHITAERHGQLLTARCSPRVAVRIGEVIHLSLDPSHVRLFDGLTERAVRGPSERSPMPS